MSASAPDESARFLFELCFEFVPVVSRRDQGHATLTVECDKTLVQRNTRGPMIEEPAARGTS